MDESWMILILSLLLKIKKKKKMRKENMWINQVITNLTLLYMTRLSLLTMPMIEINALQKKKKKISAKERNWISYTKHVRTQNKPKYDCDVLIPIDPLDDPLTLFQKIIDFNEFLQHLKIELERYATQKD